MRIAFHFIQLSLIFILFSSCGDVLGDYDTDSTNPLDIDNEICAVLNEKQAVSAHIFENNDSLTNENLFSLHSIDSNLFVSPSNDHSWSIVIDTTSFFMLLAPQQADSHFFALNFSSEFELYDDSGNLINVGNANTASRTRYVKSNQNEIVGRELLNQLDINTQSLKSPIPMQSLSETVKNETCIIKEFNSTISKLVY